MKKQYLVPVTVCVSVRVQTLLAGSIEDTSGIDGLNPGGGTTDNGITSGNARWGTVWDDPEEDENEEEENLY